LMFTSLVKKTSLYFFLFVFFLVGCKQPALAVSEKECQQQEEAKDWSAAEKCWNDYFSTKKRTLKNEIQSKTVQIDLTTGRIVSAQKTIADLEKEIDQLGGKIDRLDSSLNELSEVLVKRISETYKKGQIDPFALFFSSKNFADFISRFKYLRVIQLHDRKLLIQMETAKTNYEGQKNLKEEKQTQLESWKIKLEREKIELANIIQAKKILLTETEASYQRTLARIAAEKAKIAGVSLFGRPTEFKQWPGDDHYFNQTDTRWAMMLIGGGLYDAGDPSYMWKYGCAVTSMAMVLQKWGVAIDPGKLSQSPIYQTDLIAWQNVPGSGGFGGQIKVVGHGYGGRVSWEEIDQELAQSHWVIVYLNGVGHYVVLLAKEGDDYKMHDPYFGPNLSFSSKYSKGVVDEMVLYTR